MEVTFVLADAAQAIDGKLYLLGGGWTRVITKPGEPIPMALGVIVSMDWTESNRAVVLEVSLQSEDGKTVTVGGTAIRIPAQLEMGRPPGVRPGSPLNAALAMPLPALPLEPGGYVWVLTVDDQEYARRPFDIVVRNLGG